MALDEASRHAWIIIGASSAASCLGSAIIWVDAIWNSISKHKISLLEDRGFLIMSLSLSAGVLGATSFYSLLPKALDYIKQSKRLDSDRESNGAELLAYVLGIIACLALNWTIHVLTSQSVVHCAHDDQSHSHGHGHDGHDDHGHGHSHGDHGDHGDHEHTHETSFHSHSHSHDSHHKHSNHFHPRMSEIEQTPGFLHDRSADQHLDHHADATRDTNADATENTPLIDHSYVSAAHGHDDFHAKSSHVRQHFSLVNLHNTVPTGVEDMSTHSLIDRTRNLFTLNGRNSSACLGTCHGFQTLDSCAAETHRNFCFASDHPLGSDVPPPSIYYDEERVETSSVLGNLDDEEPEEPYELHHHHVVSRFSHLFSIGLQTALAVSLHKIPEGLMLYATNREDSTVGSHVFFALSIHNVLEGFTIASPLYLALGNRPLAVFYAWILGGGSQPLGALLAMKILPSKHLDVSTYFEFGMLVASTAGFMAVISFQMLATAVTYGGSQQQVVSWAIIGTIIVLAMKCL